MTKAASEKKLSNIQRHIHTLSVLKGVTWRVVATIDTVFLSFIFTGKIITALKIGFTELFTKIFLYYVHERIWNKIKWGRHADGISARHRRSIVKGASWRFFGTIDTIIIALFITHHPSQAFSIGFAELFTKIFLYYLHERMWLKITNRKRRGVD